MKPSNLLVSILALSCALALMAPAHAEYPDRPIKLLTPTPPGVSTTDLAARLIAEKMSARLGSPVIVVNQPGASGTLAANVIAKGPKDGYTMYLGVASALGYAKLFNRDLPYDPVKDLAPVAMLGTVPVGLFVNVASDIKTPQDLIAAAKARPDALNYSSSGIGSVTHVAIEMLMRRADVKMKHVPYGASLAFWNDLMAGTIQVVGGGVSGGMPLVKDGRLRLIATASRERSAMAPDVPAFGELFPGFDVPAWFGLVVAQGTPEPVIAKLEAAALSVFNEPSFKSTLLQAGIEVAPLSRKAYAAKLTNEMPLWESTLKDAGMSAPAK